MLSCPCTPHVSYHDCCQPYHSGLLRPETAEQLMRSRYSAYVLGRLSYLLETTHPKAVTPELGPSILTWMCSVQSWAGLEIVSVRKGQSNDQEGYVHFKAFYYEANQLHCLEENSKFIRVNGCWYYCLKRS